MVMPDYGCCWTRESRILEVQPVVIKFPEMVVSEQQIRHWIDDAIFPKIILSKEVCYFERHVDNFLPLFLLNILDVQ